MEDYWGPPSFAWSDTGLFIAQNVGQLYIGAVPLLLLLLAGLRGRLWEPQIRFFTIAAIVMLFYALGWYTPVSRLSTTLLPGVNLYRRPADATFLIGALGPSSPATPRIACSPSRRRPFPRQHTLWLAAGSAALSCCSSSWRCGATGCRCCPIRSA